MATLADVARRIPFRLRLTLIFVGVMVVLFGGLALLLYTRFEASLDAGVNDSLRTRAAELTALARGDSDGRLPPLPESGGAFAQILTPDSRVLDATPGHAAPLPTRTDVRRALREPLLIERRQGSRVLAQPAAIGSPAVLVVGVSLAQRDRALKTLGELLFIGGPAVLVLTCLGGYLLAAGALAPVERMRRQAARISGTGRGERLPVPEARDELHRLGTTLNEMISRLETATERERELVADAGHELRTPLAILKLELEELRHALSVGDGNDSLERGLRSATEEVDRLAKLAENLLVIARADDGRLAVEKRPLQVQQLLRTVSGRIAGARHGEAPRVAPDGAAELVVAADAAWLEQALLNMVANAHSHGAGPVVLAARERRGAVELHVLDEGRGFAPEFLPRAFERFSRGDPARSDGGAGLGLVVVRSIAEAHGGEAGAANREGGGADVWVSLPR